MWRTRVGYAGGTTKSPTYRSIGDHTECFQVDYDPATISYEELLDHFWISHDPTHAAWKTQYASLILTTSDEQLAQAEDSAKRLESAFGAPAATRIEPLGEFWLAEDYHQKYYLKNDPVLMMEFREFYPTEAGILGSTAAARVNGYLYGASGCLRLDQELPVLGLSERAAEHLRDACKRG